MFLHESLKKFILQRLKSDLSDKELYAYGRELWVIDRDMSSWFLYIDCSGNLWYNQIFFNNYFKLFSLEKKQFDIILKSWFEKKFNIPVRQLMRKNSDMSWQIIQMMNSKVQKWSLTERNGFSYEIVKRYLGLVRENQRVIVEDFVFE